MTHGVSLPSGWAVATIDDITAYVQRGKSPAYAVKSDLPVVNQKCVRWNGVDPRWLKYIHPDQWPQWGEERFLRVGDVLWNSTGTGTIGRAALFRGLPGYARAVVDSHVTILRTRHYFPGLLHYWIMSPSVQAKIERMQAGSTNQVELSRSEVLATEVVVPPLPEQQRIVEALEAYLTRLDNAVALLERVRQSLKRYRASVLKAAVEGRLVPTEACLCRARHGRQAELARREGRGYEPASELLKRILAERKTRWIEDAAEKARAKAEEKAGKAGQPWTAGDNAAALEKGRAKAAKQYKEPTAPDLSAIAGQAGTTDLPDLPEGWCWATAQQLGDHRLGKMLDAAKNQGKLRPYLRNANVQWFRFDLDDTSEMRVTDEEYGEVSVQAGDLVICEGGEPGRCAVWERQESTIAIQKALHRIRLHPDARPWMSAFQLAVDAESGRLAASFTGTTIKHFTGESLRAYAFALAPSTEQARIVTQAQHALGAMEGILAGVERARVRCARFRQSVLKWAFEGKLVAQDPDDEPASVLLERIREERAATGAPTARGRKRRSGE